jgi:hypothetical protein
LIRTGTTWIGTGITSTSIGIIITATSADVAVAERGPLFSVRVRRFERMIQV